MVLCVSMREKKPEQGPGRWQGEGMWPCSGRIGEGLPEEQYRYGQERGLGEGSQTPKGGGGSLGWSPTCKAGRPPLGMEALEAVRWGVLQWMRSTTMQWNPFLSLLYGATVAATFVASASAQNLTVTSGTNPPQHGGLLFSACCL
jgi:hypothetical protein